MAKKKTEKSAHDKEIERLVKLGIIHPFSIPDNMPNINFIEEVDEKEDVFPDFVRPEQVHQLKTDKKYFNFMAKSFGGKSHPEKGAITLNNMIKNWDKDRAAGKPLPVYKKAPWELWEEEAEEERE